MKRDIFQSSAPEVAENDRFYARVDLTSKAYELSVWDHEAGRMATQLDVPSKVHCMRFHPEINNLLVLAGEGFTVGYDVENSEGLFEHKTDKQFAATDIEFRPDGKVHLVLPFEGDSSIFFPLDMEGLRRVL